jgi:hypothetical protein
MSAAVMETANQVKSMSQHFERCLASDHNSNFENSTDFYALLASDTGRSVDFLKAKYRDGLEQIVQGLEEILSEIDLPSIQEDNHIDDFFLVQIASLIMNFCIAYDELLPPQHRDTFIKASDNLSVFLDSKNAFEEYPDAIKSINSPLLRCSRYNLVELLG